MQTDDDARQEKRFGIDPANRYLAIADGDMKDGKDTDGAAAEVKR